MPTEHVHRCCAHRNPRSDQEFRSGAGAGRPRPHGAARARYTASSAPTAPGSRRPSASCWAWSKADGGSVAAARRRPVDRRRRAAPPNRLRTRRCHAVAVADRRRDHRPAGPHARRHRREAPRRADRALRPGPAQEGTHLFEGQPAEGLPDLGVLLAGQAAAARRAQQRTGSVDGERFSAMRHARRANAVRRCCCPATSWPRPRRCASGSPSSAPARPSRAVRWSSMRHLQPHLDQGRNDRRPRRSQPDQGCRGRQRRRQHPARAGRQRKPRRAHPGARRRRRAQSGQPAAHPRRAVPAPLRHSVGDGRRGRDAAEVARHEHRDAGPAIAPAHQLRRSAARTSRERLGCCGFTCGATGSCCRCGCCCCRCRWPPSTSAASRRSTRPRPTAPGSRPPSWPARPSGPCTDRSTTTASAPPAFGRPGCSTAHRGRGHPHRHPAHPRRRGDRPDRADRLDRGRPVRQPDRGAAAVVRRVDRHRR